MNSDVHPINSDTIEWFLKVINDKLAEETGHVVGVRIDGKNHIIGANLMTCMEAEKQGYITREVRTARNQESEAGRRKSEMDKKNDLPTKI